MQPNNPRRSRDQFHGGKVTCGVKPSEHIQRILKRLPHEPGVYQHYDSKGELLYIGKAKDLRKRVASYFTKQAQQPGKTRLLVSRIADIKFIVVETELDALLLENSLIKAHQPRYNIMLKDDKTFPSIVIRKERFPRVFATRQIVQDGSEYFGPFASVGTMHAVLDIARKLYPVRTCSYNLSEENVAAGKFRVCLEYHIGNCAGPCAGHVSEADYANGISAIRRIIGGNLREVAGEYKRSMAEAADRLDFESAHEIKVRLGALEKFQAKSAVVHHNIHNVEVYTVVSDTQSGFVNHMKIMDGAVVSGRTLEFKKQLEETDVDLLAFGVLEFRDRNAKLQPASAMILTNLALPRLFDGVDQHVPLRGDKKRLIELSERNAKYFMLDRRKQQQQVDPQAATQRILSTLQSDLHLTELPVHIECFDNSNFQGQDAASACVVFRNGKPAKRDYRKFDIKTVEGPDDYASMREVVERRYRRLLDEKASLPQLIIVDGGKGQLSSAVSALEALGLMGRVAIIGIAKRLEEIYFPSDPIPLHLDKRSESLRLIQRLRDEAHRFSLAHHRNKRSKSHTASVLDTVPGIGPATREKLLLHFGSVDGITAAARSASAEAELLAAVNLKVARALIAHFAT
jgi:excinuclease ABC subunit C